MIEKIIRFEAKDFPVADKRRGDFFVRVIRVPCPPSVSTQPPSILFCKI